MALKVKNAIECDTNVLGELRWKNYRTIIKFNRRATKEVNNSVLSPFNFNLNMIWKLLPGFQYKYFKYLYSSIVSSRGDKKPVNQMVQ